KVLQFWDLCGCSARVVTVPPGPLIRVEGQPVSIRCDVKEYTGPSEQDFEWNMLKDAKGQKTKIISSFDSRYSDQMYSKRVASGDISMVRLQDNEVELKIAEVKLTDAGFYECQTPSTDYVISGNYMAQVQLTVIPNTLKVSPKTPLPVISEGSDLTLSCNVTRELIHPTYLSVTWSVKKGTTSEEILTFGPQGDVVTGSRFARRYADGGIRLVPGRNGVFELVISRMTTSDEGNYECNGTEWTHESGGNWIKIAESTKEMGTVAVTPTEPNFTLTLVADVNPQTTAEPTELACRVTNIANLPLGGRLGVSWEHTSLPGLGDDPQTSHPIGSLDANGNLLPGSIYMERMKSGALTLSRVQPNTFKLRILRTQEIDMGQYVCSVSAWSVNSQGDMVKTSENRSSPLTVRWDAKRPIVNVVAKRIREASVGGSTFELGCSVTTQNIGDAGYSVLIQSQDSLDSTVRTIMTLSPDNVVQHGGATDPNRRDNLVLTKSGAAEFRFRLAGVQLSDRGYYWCDVTAWTKQQPGQAWTKASSSESNKIRINFLENGPSFSIAIKSDDSSVYPWETAKMECSLSVSGSSPKTDDLAYEVKWFFTRLRGGPAAVQVASVDRFGVVRKINRNSSSDTRTNTMTVITTSSVVSSDSGEYFCSVTPWYLSASTGAWTEAQELTSSKVFLAVKFAVWDSLKLPLLYGASASLGVGLFSLVLGLVCAQCCCRNTAHLPRSRNKLMDLEMD
uniref:Prostaglandin F2 receptor negative regulator-like n=1 Tax=Neolamprologus brichardi TaxID=32507 RepID=A0A3Q4I657_NEOBR